MQPNFLLEKQVVHVWQVSLSDFFLKENELASLLTSDEVDRANRFRFPEHKKRFVIARAMLRSILSRYTHISPADIRFSYGPKGKPYLSNNSFNVQFNLSHSENMAIYAFTQEAEIGVDIQKIDEKNHEAIAKRFFSAEENRALNELPQLERARAFCRLWACKEALIKAAGEGLYVPLEDFTVSLKEQNQLITLTHGQQPIEYYLEIFSSHSDYQSAFATNQIVKEVFYYTLNDANEYLVI
jgi:4'-phosphopantetheinyl transferase